MYKVISTTLALVLLLGSGCKDEPLGITFNLDYSANTTIESGSLLSIPFDMFTPDVTTNSEAEFESNDTRKDKIISTNLSSLSLKITSPSGKTFSFLKSVYLYINAEGLSEERFAYKENVSSADAEIDLITESLDLSEYIKKDKFSLRVEAVTRETMNQDVDITADMSFRIKAEVL